VVRRRPTIVDVFWEHVRFASGRVALRWRNDRSWVVKTWQTYGLDVRRAAAGLIRQGLLPGDRAAILSNNRWEWHAADLAIMSAGGVTVPIYQTSSSSQVTYALAHSEARFCFVENVEQLAKVLLRRHELPKLERVYVVESSEGLDDAFVGEFVDVIELGDDALRDDPQIVDSRVAMVTTGDLATLVYTSGTTGPPKATMLSHGNIIANIRNVTAVIPIDQNDRFLSFLPLSHIAERTVSHFGQIVSGGETWFAASLSSVPDDIKACRPTVFFAVPRVWEKLHDAIVSAMGSQPRVMQQAAERLWAPPGPTAREGFAAAIGRGVEHRLLDATIGRRVRSHLGLNRCRFFVSGAAPIAPELLGWFARIGIPIAEVYGQTEACGVTTLNPPGAIRLGTVGPPAPGVTVRIAADGEVLVRGANVSSGYFKAASATEDLIDADGWMHSGDLGSVDADGYLTITGRKKDLIITSSGKNVSPQEIESQLELEPLISHAVVVGDNRPYLVALVTLDAEALTDWASRHAKLAESQALLDDPELIEEVGDIVTHVNERHARVEQIKEWRLLPNDFTIATDELTPTLKVKRQVVLERNAQLIDELYAGRAGLVR
jgi:long-chain acyl-CoA synthetase